VRHRLIGLAVLGGLVVPPSTALAATPQQGNSGSGGIGVRLVDVPASSRDPRARSYIVDRLAPGSHVRRSIEISNSTQAAVAVVVYAAAARLGRSGFAFAPAHGQNELSSWTSLSRVLVSLPPGAAAVESVAIDVPKDASPGERYAVVWAEVAGAASDGVTLVNRVGVRMYVSIGPGGTPAPSFAVISLAAERAPTGEPLVIVRVRNSGQRTIAIGGTLTLARGPGGLRAGPFPVDFGTGVAPGRSKSVEVTLDRRLPLGPWQARASLRSGSVRRTRTATIAFPRQAGAAGATHVTLIVLLLLVLLASAVVGLLIVRRRPRGRGDLRRDPPGPRRQSVWADR
jgi:hypothetical protein